MPYTGLTDPGEDPANDYDQATDPAYYEWEPDYEVAMEDRRTRGPGYYNNEFLSDNPDFL